MKPMSAKPLPPVAKSNMCAQKSWQLCTDVVGDVVQAVSKMQQLCSASDASRIVFPTSKSRRVLGEEGAATLQRLHDVGALELQNHDLKGKARRWSGSGG